MSILKQNIKLGEENMRMSKCLNNFRIIMKEKSNKPMYNNEELYASLNSQKEALFGKSQPSVFEINFT